MMRALLPVGVKPHGHRSRLKFLYGPIQMAVRDRGRHGSNLDNGYCRRRSRLSMSLG
jgi:hypothetical protein